MKRTERLEFAINYTGKRIDNVNRKIRNRERKLNEGKGNADRLRSELEVLRVELKALQHEHESTRDRLYGQSKHEWNKEIQVHQKKDSNK